VLPFTNMSSYPEQEYFTDGISEDRAAEPNDRRFIVSAAAHDRLAGVGRSGRRHHADRRMRR